MSPGFAGRHPTSCWVSTLDVGLSSGTTTAKKPKCSTCFPGSDADDGKVEAATDDSSRDVAKRDALIADTVQS